MQHFTIEASEKHSIAILVKNSVFTYHELMSVYVETLRKRGIDVAELVVASLEYNDKGKAPMSLIAAHLDELLPALQSVGTELIYCADAAYFKKLTGKSKAEPNLGYCLPCTYKGFEHLKIILGVNHKSLIYNPANEEKLNQSIDTLVNVVNGSYVPPGNSIIQSAKYLYRSQDMVRAIADLHQYPEVAADIEAASLDFDKAGIGTIGFAWTQHVGISGLCDLKPLAHKNDEGHYSEYVINIAVRGALKNFFETYKGKVIWHNSPYDLKVLIYNLWMKDGLDMEGLLTGLEVMTRCMDDTKVIAYLATNTTAGNHLSLKVLAHEFAGNWAKGDDDIKDIRFIPVDDLLKYNLVDCLATLFVRNKYYPIMVADKQEDLYHNLMMPSQKTIIQTELHGMPLNPTRVQEVKAELTEISDAQVVIMQASSAISASEKLLTTRAWDNDYHSRKNKAKNPDKIFPKGRATYPTKVFNPNSPDQKQVLLYEVMQLPVVDLTKTKQPATGADTLAKLINHTDDLDYKKVIQSLIDFAKSDKILSTFISAFERAIDKGDGVVYLHGNFNLGGTVSGRLSSSRPNLQNMPSGSLFGKLIKSCFVSPEGWLFGGADFNSLEDYISALTTKDPNKLRVYLDGYDGHCLRALSYFPDQLPGIVNTVESVNSIKKLYESVRQASKAPTFALTYGGTWRTLVKNLGMDKATAKQIEDNYHSLYAVSDQWVSTKLAQASSDGHVTVAFGLRVRTPLLAQTLRNNRATPFEAEAEGRTAGNALGQSYGLLTNRALNEFMERVWASPYRLDIKPVAMIHDAIYLLMRDDIDVVHWVNENLIDCMQWQDLPELHHDEVKLGAELDTFYPNWSKPVTIPNYSTPKVIREKCVEHIKNMNA